MAENFNIEFEFRNKRFKDAERGLNAFAKSLGDGVKRSGPVLSKELRKYLDSAADALAARHGTSWPGGTTENTLSRRSGRLLGAIKGSVVVSGKDVANIRGQIGAPGIEYGRIHEFGGTIRPKSAQYLTIPLPAALNQDGTPKKQKARDWDKTFVTKSKAGNLIIFQKRGSGIVPLYVLKTEVKIPPRLKMGETLRSQLPFFVDKAMGQMVKELVA